MPIHLPYQFMRLASEEFAETDYTVMKHAFACHSDLGRLCDESIYQADLALRLNEANVRPTERELPVRLTFETFSKTFLLDMVTQRKAIYELKAVANLTSEHESQLLNYLLITESTRGKLINFRPESVESRFVNANATLSQRRQFSVVRDSWTAPKCFSDLVFRLLKDWGVGLSLSLYRQAIVQLLGGEETVVRAFPMVRGDTPIGNQRFHMVDDTHAFVLTAYKSPPSSQEFHLGSMIGNTTLSAIHWININMMEVRFTTVT